MAADRLPSGCRRGSSRPHDRATDGRSVDYRSIQEPSRFPSWSPQEIIDRSLYALQLEARAYRFVSRLHVGPFLDMMVGVDEREHGVMHVSVLQTTSNIEKVELGALPIRRQLPHHARPIAGVAVVGQEQPVAVQIEHSDGIVRSVGTGHR